MNFRPCLLEGCSQSSPAKDEASYSASKDYKVEPDRPVAHIVGVRCYSFFIAHITASVHLPEARDPWLNSLVQFVHVAVLRDLGIYDGPWPNQAHLFAQYVPK